MFHDMRKFSLLSALVVVTFFLLAGCSGPVAQRVPDLAPDAVVKTVYDAAKNNRLTEAALYISPESLADSSPYSALTGQNDVTSLKNTNLLSLNQVTQQGTYAVVVATLQQQDSLAIQVRPVGLEKVGGEWYIVDMSKIYKEAKYQLLAQMLLSI
jgi:hypothetical protein